MHYVSCLSDLFQDKSHDCIEQKYRKIKMYERKYTPLIIISKFVTYMKHYRVLLGIGSNDRPVENINRVKAMLLAVLSDIQYSSCVPTKVIGMYAADFLNCLVLGTTEMALEELNQKLKTMEKKCGRTALSKDLGCIPVDIDVLLYGKEKYHENDWDRPYIQQLLKEMDIE